MAIRYTNLPDNKSKPFGGAYSVHDRELTSYRDETIRMFTVNNNYTEKNAEIIKQDFLQTYKQGNDLYLGGYKQSRLWHYFEKNTMEKLNAGIL